MAANKLYINDGNVDIAIAELGIVSGKQQALLGDLERDLILRTSGNIQIQVGNKFYPLSFTGQTITSGNATIINSSTTIINKIADLSTLTYPGDGNFVYIRENQAFYVTVDSSYVRINNTSTSSGGGTTPISKIYLSFDEQQDLSGGEKSRVVLNTGGVINSISEISSYTPADVYPNQIVYALSESRHYHLVDVNNPSLAESWQEIYLNLADGGVVLGPTTFTITDNVNKSYSALHVSSSYAFKQIANVLTPIPVFTLGSADYSSGLAVWNNDGNVYLQSLVNNSARGFNFVTTVENGSTLNPLTVLRNNVGIGGPVDYNYSLAVTYNALFKNNSYFTNNLQSPDYVTGDSGMGFGLIRDSENLWTLEVDKLIVRKDHTNLSSIYITEGLNGSQIFNYSITIREAFLLETIPLYIKAVSSGKYSDTSGTIKPLSSRARNAKVIHQTLATIDNEVPVSAYETIRLSYAIGDTFDDNSVDTTTSYNKSSSGSYYTPTGAYSYNTGTGSFVSDPSGDLVLINTIASYHVSSSSSATMAVGDLLYAKNWNESKGYQNSIHAEVVALASDGGYYIYAYDNVLINSGMQLVKVGNTSTGLSFMQNNAADIGNPFTELLSNVNSFRALYNNYYYEQDTDFPDTTREDSISSKINTRVKIGDLSNLYDTDLVLSTQQYGIYSDNIYAKGNFVLNQSKFNNVPTVSGPTYSPFLLLNTSGRLQQTDMNTVLGSYAPINNPQFTGTVQMQLANGGFSAATFTNLPSGQNFTIWRNMMSANDEVDFVSVPGIRSGTTGGFAWYSYNATDGTSGGLVQNMMLNGINSTLTISGKLVVNTVSNNTSPTLFATYNPTTKEFETISNTNAATILGTGGGTGMINPMTSLGDLIVGATGGAPTRLPAGTNGQVLTMVGGVPTWV